MSDETRLRFRALECLRGDCDEKWWGWDPQRPPEQSATCDGHIWFESHTFLARSRGPGLSPVPVGGVGG